MRQSAWIAPALLLPLTACRVRYSALDTASPEATRITNLHWLVLWICGAVSFILIASLAIALFRRRTAENREGQRRRTIAVAAAAFVSTLVLLWILTASVIAGRAVATPAGPEALRIQIVGHQWWWEVIYPADPPSQTVITANEIHVPAGRPVLFELSTTDVIPASGSQISPARRICSPDGRLVMFFDPNGRECSKDDVQNSAAISTRTWDFF